MPKTAVVEVIDTVCVLPVITMSIVLGQPVTVVVGITALTKVVIIILKIKSEVKNEKR